ncbi:MAG: peptidoglycan editing factor PgeF [Candidatus Omnitrophica bacterium]|nr:peptidoglycan editing factor PgeF [Candidatus Omnitrophota bacterium]
MTFRSQTPSQIVRLPSYFLWDCFNSGKLVAGTTHKACPDRSALCRELQIARENAVGLKQCHGDRIAWVHQGQVDEIAETDALVTNQSGVLLTIRTADCVPVFVFDPETLTIALIHAGWKGARLGIVKKTILELAGRSGSDVKRLQAALGPSIRSCCYEFRSDQIPEFKSFMKPVNGKHHFDLIGYLFQELEGLGIPQSSIFDSGLCTFCNPGDFFSYRREQENAGRMISFMMLP